MFLQGEKVVYRGDSYIVLWIYDNNQCEIQREDDQYRIEVTHTSQLAHQEMTVLHN